LKANLGLEKLRARNIEFQYMFYLDETNGQQRNLGLQEIDLIIFYRSDDIPFCRSQKLFLPPKLIKVKNGPM
jgi:hypothetical protein